jgi:hypothetical protein
MEIKFALNGDLQSVDEQLERYYGMVKKESAQIASEMEGIFKQKLELQLYDQEANRIQAMKTLTFSKDINDFQFLLVLVDYSENSKLLDLKKLGKLSFANQIKVFHTGFGMWQHNVHAV